MSADNNPIVSPNDLKVVEFHNSEDFTFTPVMGCMYDGRPIFGITGAPGINAGESLTLPYHVGMLLATNLAKQVQLRRAPTVDPAGIPTGVPLWSVENLDVLKNSYITELYSETKPIAVSETDRLMAKVEEYKAMVDSLMKSGVQPQVSGQESVPPGISAIKNAYQDKQEVIKQLEVRGIPHDKRASKSVLEKLLVPA